MSEEEIIALRREKLQRLRERGIDPYPPRVQRTHTAQEALDLLGEAAETPEVVSVAGRITAMRSMGKASFLDLRDSTARIQVYIKKESVGADAYEMLKDIDIGDFLGVTGSLFRTKTNEPSVDAQSFELLAKALRAPPEKWHGLQDVEVRYRQRYLDLMANQEVRDTFLVRSRAISAMRRFLDSRGYVEVETPILQASAGGAAARPFITHHNALDRDFYLRIAIELYLKRLVVGGFDRVYEIGRIFRNEGVSTKYNPEFTMLESYAAYADYNEVMAMVEEMVSSVALEVLETTKVTQSDGVTLDLAPPWPRITMRDAIRDRSGVDINEHPDLTSIRKAAEGTGIRCEEFWGRGKIIDELATVHVEPHLIQPTFLIDYPIELSPLAKKKPSNPRFVERFEFFIAGRECGNAYTELNDPIDQRERLIEQAKLRQAGDEEVEIADEDFIVALEHGMPPTGGLGIGIDRLIMAFTGNSSIREVILFPALRERDA
jgi:lysyl-tRNA synthetase class 2